MCAWCGNRSTAARAGVQGSGRMPFRAGQVPAVNCHPCWNQFRTSIALSGVREGLEGHGDVHDVLVRIRIGPVRVVDLARRGGRLQPPSVEP